MNKETCEQLYFVLGIDLLCEVAGTDQKTIYDFNYQKRPLPKDTAARLGFIAEIIDCLKGSYSNQGISNWLQRPRIELGNKPPVAMLKLDWNPNQSGPQKILELAKKLTGSGNAT